MYRQSIQTLINTHINTHTHSKLLIQIMCLYKSLLLKLISSFFMFNVYKQLYPGLCNCTKGQWQKQLVRMWLMMCDWLMVFNGISFLNMAPLFR